MCKMQFLLLCMSVCLPGYLLVWRLSADMSACLSACMSCMSPYLFACYVCLCHLSQLVFLPIYSMCVSICLYVILSVCPSLHMSACLSAYLSACLSACHGTSLSACLSVFLSACLLHVQIPACICLLVYLHVYLSASLSVCLFAYLSVCLCIAVFMSICLAVGLSAGLPDKKAYLIRFCQLSLDQVSLPIFLIGIPNPKYRHRAHNPCSSYPPQGGIIPHPFPRPPPHPPQNKYREHLRKYKTTLFLALEM